MSHDSNATPVPTRTLNTATATETATETETETATEIPLKYAKSMSGHVYSYAVDTIGEFKQKVSEQYDIPIHYLQVLIPEEHWGIDEKTGEPPHPITVSDDVPLQEDKVYALLMNVPPGGYQLLSWIKPQYLQPHRLIDNPKYWISDTEVEYMTSSELDHFTKHPIRMDIIRRHYSRITRTGWRYLFIHEEAVPFLEEVYEETRSQFYENGQFLAMNTGATSLLLRLLQEATPIRHSNLFWRNLHVNENAYTIIVEHFPEHLYIPYLSQNIEAAPYHLAQLERLGEEYAMLLDWRYLSSLPNTYPILSRFPQMIDRKTIQLNPDPAVIPWIRSNLSPEEIQWNNIVRHNHPAFMDWVEENLDCITSHSWKELCLNPSAVPLLARYPEHIHWTLLSCNPSPDVIPMIQDYLTSYMYPEDTDPPHLPLSYEGASQLGISLVWKRMREQYEGDDLWHDKYRTIVNRGAITLHPHALPLLREYPLFIHYDALSIRPDIYEEVTCFLE